MSWTATLDGGVNVRACTSDYSGMKEAFFFYFHGGKCTLPVATLCEKGISLQMQPLEKDGDKKELFLLSLFQQKPTAVANAMGVFAAGWNPTSQSVPPPS